MANDKNDSRAFDHREVETEWQRAWETASAFTVPDDIDDPAYVLAMFPYTSGNLHMGHVRNYTITDSYARFERLRGEAVLHPMGWDAFGLPAENAAEERDTDPRSFTESCIDSMREQLQRMGFGYDWDREVKTCNPEYYRWNQWLFRRFWDAGLVERQETELNWCDSCETVLADEQVEGDDERCWRCDTPIRQRELGQWFFTITDYADELLAELDRLDNWPANVREMQRNWIGRQTGHILGLDTEHPDGETTVDVFTTRLDTLYGATFVVLSPGHPLAERLGEADEAVADYCDRAAASDDGLAQTSGVETDARAINPATGEELPVYVADYVLDDVGTGAIFAVPAHDERDHAFAEAHDVPIRRVVVPDNGERDDADDEVFTDDGVLVDSGEYDGTDSETARERFAEAFDARERTEYDLRDWAISRQRYWGTPIPLVECDDCGTVPLPDDRLPVELPEFVHTAGNPLDAATDWQETACPECGGPAVRETDTMNTFVDSSWYFLRYVSPGLETAPFDRERASDWLPVDRYVGGSEHAVMHLLYARFFTKVLADLDLLDGVREPFDHLTTQGMVLGEDGEKMSKSKGNGVSPTELVEEYGADTARTFVSEVAQPETEFAWDPEGVESARQFLDGVYSLVSSFADGEFETTDADRTVDESVRLSVDATVEEAASKYEAFRFNHAVRAVRQLLSLLRRYRDATTPDHETFEHGLTAVLTVLSPVAPHVCEEAWATLGNDALLATGDWPDTDVPEGYETEQALVDATRDDVHNILDTVGIDNPERINLTVAPTWRHRVYRLAREADDDIVGTVMADEDLRAVGSAAADYAKQLAPEANALEPQLSSEREHEALERARWLLEDEFDATVAVSTPDDPTATDAEPGRPAIDITPADS
ncbi:leucine--tRNA ligase [Halobaculum sp. MBLA0143]|uniref:leucine--tRNA ligase n=1 Tax=Halobaculum sp. MBLA0143 TaxID=3079933 RepID=UPI003523C239